MFEQKKTKTWSVSIDSPSILSGLPKDMEKYVDYDYTNIIGAKTILECELSKVIEIDAIKINPSNSYGLSLMQVCIEKMQVDPTNSSTGTNPSDNYVLEKILNNQIDLSKPFTISFAKSKVKKIIFIYNQDTYTKKQIQSSESENISRSMHSIVASLREAKKKEHNQFQDLVLSFFRKGLSINEARRNQYLYSEYYTYRYPISEAIDSTSFYNDLINNKGSFDYIRESRIPQNENKLTRMVESIVGHILGNKFNLINTTIGKDNRNLISSGRISTLSEIGFYPEFNVNNKDSFSLKLEKPIIPGLTFNSYSSATETKENINSYNYSFSIGSVEFFNTKSNKDLALAEKDKAIYISSKVPVPGRVLGIKAKIKTDDTSILTTDDINLQFKNSYELSFCLKDTPQDESDWIPIIPFGNLSIDSEVLFFDKVTKIAKLRFHPKNSSITLYENGKIVPRFRYTVNVSSSTVQYASFVEDNMYVCSYEVDNINYSQEYIDVQSIIESTPIASYITDGVQGEYFASSGVGNAIQLSNYPYADPEKMTNAIYSPRSGTIFPDSNTRYNPVEIKLFDGSYAVNLTNYVVGDFNRTDFYDTSSILFYQNGRNIIFNKQINSPFYVLYNYINNNIRFRVVIRNNYLNSFYPGSLDNIVVKMKINNMDNFSNKILGM